MNRDPKPCFQHKSIEKATRGETLFRPWKESVLWIRIGFNADPDPGSQNQCESWRIRIRILIRLLRHKKLNFYMKNVFKKGKRSKTYLWRYKSIFERQKTRFICQFCPISMLLDPDPDPHFQYGSDPRYPNECWSKWIRIGSGSTTLEEITIN